VYVNKSGQELTGRIAYGQYRKVHVLAYHSVVVILLVVVALND